MLKAVTTDPFLDDISLDAPWALVETFSKMPRWKPQDVNAGADIIAGMLKSFGVPVTLHEPTLYLSIPFSAQVRVGDQVMKAKPPAYSRDCRAGLEGALVYVPAAYSRSIGTLFNKNQDPALSAAERLKGKIVISEGFAFPQKIHEFEQKGAIGVIAINPGADVHWGICTSIWGTPDLDDLPRKPGIPVVAVNNPDGQELIALAENGGRATIVHRDGGGLVSAEGAGGRDQGAARAGEVRAGARPLRQLGRRRRRQRDRRRDAARARARALEEPQEAQALGAHRVVARATRPAATPARPGSPMPSRSTSTRTASRRSTATRPAAAGRRCSRTSRGCRRPKPTCSPPSRR